MEIEVEVEVEMEMKQKQEKSKKIQSVLKNANQMMTVRNAGENKKDKKMN